MYPYMTLERDTWQPFNALEEIEDLREKMVNVFTTIGVVAALILTMEKTGEADSGILVWGLGFRRGSNNTGTQGQMGFTYNHTHVDLICMILEHIYISIHVYRYIYVHIYIYTNIYTLAYTRSYKDLWRISWKQESSGKLNRTAQTSIWWG